MLNFNDYKFQFNKTGIDKYLVEFYVITKYLQHLLVG